MYKRTRMYFSLILLFILGCKDGFIALWTDSANEPARVFPYSVASLPPADQSALEHGIPIRNQRDLQQVIEDYLS